MDHSESIKEKTIFDSAQDYYRGERISNALLFLIGAIGIIWTFLLYIWRQGQLSSGLFYSTFPLGLFFIITGAYRFLRSLKRYKNSQDEISGKAYLIDDENAHLQGRLVRFRNKRKVDLTGVFFGFVIMSLSVFGSWNHIILGTSISMTIFSSVLLAFDLFGQFRTEEFIHHITKMEDYP